MNQSFYKEELFFMTEGHHVGEKLQQAISTTLTDNTAVGIVGGVCDENGYRIDFLSGFAMSLMEMEEAALQNLSQRYVQELVMEQDQRHLLQVMESSQQICLLRLKTTKNMPSWVRARFHLFEENGVSSWIMSVFSIQFVLDALNRSISSMFTGILDLQDEWLYIYGKPKLIAGLLGPDMIVSYDKVVEREIEESVYTSYEEVARSLLTIDNAVSQLENNDTFECTLPHKMQNGLPAIIRHKYVYADESKRFVLITCEDITETCTKEIVTGALTLNGFLMKGYEEVLLRRKDYTIAYFGIRNFRTLRDNYGFEITDRLLRKVKHYLRESCLRPICIARNGNDYFACLFPTENADVSQIRKLCNEMHFEDEIFPSVHLTCGLYDMKKEKYDPGEFLQMCMQAMTAEHQVKHDYVNPVRTYKAEYTKENAMAVELVESFETALAEEQFEVYYQPIFDVRTQKIASAEALVRWHHPTYGFLSPGVFIPLFEKYGMITKLDEYVATHALRFQEGRYAKGEAMVPISVNFSRRDTEDWERLHNILSKAMESPIPMEYCELEITESAYMAMNAESVAFVKEAHEDGFTVLVDDFGSGYSSFANMAEYVYDILKLDMAFAKIIHKNPKTDSVIRSMIQMSHEIGVKVVAEGVETQEQYQFLRDIGCDYIQGYYFTKPMPEAAFEKMLEEE